MNEGLAYRPAAFGGLVGVARRDITPPIGIQGSAWAASSRAVFDGTHRRLEATAVVITALDDKAPVVLVGLDHIEFGDLMSGVIHWLDGELADGLAVDESRVMIACSHTHSSPTLNSDRLAIAGGEYLGAYLELVRASIIEAAREAYRNAEPSTITWGTGRCDLATNRDLADPDDAEERYLVGFNPERVADDTVVVGRVTRDSDSRIVGTIVNYACHATVLGPDSSVASPDFVGGMREIVESRTQAAPCLFLQGASGELAPAYQYSDDLELADRQGRRLGYAVLSALEGMLAPGKELVMSRVWESGAPLAVWSPKNFEPDQTLSTVKLTSEFPIKTLRSTDEWDSLINDSSTPWAAERLVRQRGMSHALSGQQTSQVPSWAWRLGTSILVGHPNEAYSDLQVELRSEFPELALVVMNLVNNGDVVAYLSPARLSDENIYQVWQSPYGPEALDRLIVDLRKAIRDLMKEGSGSAIKRAIRETSDQPNLAPDAGLD